MEKFEFFKKQAKQLLKDYKSRVFIENENGYCYNPKYFHDIELIFMAYNVDEDASFTLMNAQHIVARLAGFSKWSDLLQASEPILEIGKLLLTHRQSYELKIELESLCKKSRKMHKNRSTVGDVKISIVDNWKLYEKNELQDVDDYTKLEAFKKEFLELDSPNKIKTQKVTIDFGDNIDAQDMLTKIMKKKNLSPEEAILSSINVTSSLKIVSSRWATSAVISWRLHNQYREPETLEKSLIEVNLNKDQISLLEVVMKNKKVSLEMAVLCFMIFTLEGLGYHI